MSSAPAFASTPRLAITQVSAANTGRDGTGTIVSVWTPGVNGSKVEQIDVEATVTTTAGMVRFFLSADGGTTWKLWAEIPVAVVTPSATVAAFTATKKTPNLILPPGYRLGAATHNAEAINLVVTGGDY